MNLRLRIAPFAMGAVGYIPPKIHAKNSIHEDRLDFHEEVEEVECSFSKIPG